MLCGFAVTPQYEVRDTAGQVVARADLRIDGTNRLPEYDGAEHHNRDRHRRDLRREKALSRLQLERYGYTADEILRTPTRLLLDAERACGLPHDPRRLRPWLAQLRQASLSSRGRRRLHERLGRYANCALRPSHHLPPTVRGNGWVIADGPSHNPAKVGVGAGGWTGSVRTGVRRRARCHPRRRGRPRP